MKRFLSVICAVVMALSLCACSQTRPQIDATGNFLTFPDTISLWKNNDWPSGILPDNIPVPSGKVNWVMLDGENNACGVQITNMTEESVSAYCDLLKEAGFEEIKAVADAAKKQSLVSIGTLYSDGIVTVSLAFSEPVVMLTIVELGLEGKKVGLLGSGNLTNLYSSAYSTYDAQTGIGVYADIFVAEEERVKPALTQMAGVITVIMENRQTTIPLYTMERLEAFSVLTETGILGESGEKGIVIVSGMVSAENAVAGCGSFCQQYEITIP